MSNRRSDAWGVDHPGRILLRVEEAAQVCGLSRTRMWQLIASGEVPSVKIGRSRRVPVDELRAWVKDQSVPAARVESSVRIPRWSN